MDSDYVKILAENQDLKKKIEKLGIDLEVSRQRQIEQEKNLNKLLREKSALITKEQNRILKENELQTQVNSWERVVDELAHSINTDIFIAANEVLKLERGDVSKKIETHLTHIRNLTDLIMRYLRRDQLKNCNDKLVEFYIIEAVDNQIYTIKDALSILRLSTRQHQNNLAKMEVIKTISGDCTIKIPIDFKEALNLVIKDLLRNAFKNTKEDNPEVKVELEDIGEKVVLSISNNLRMDFIFKKWFEEGTLDDPVMSKSSKVGLRIIKQWLKFLGIEYNVTLSEIIGETKITIYIPKEVKIEEV